MALDYSIIGERIRKARLENNITQEKLAEELDVSIAFVSRIECFKYKRRCYFKWN